MSPAPRAEPSASLGLGGSRSCSTWQPGFGEVPGSGFAAPSLVFGPGSGFAALLLGRCLAPARASLSTTVFGPQTRPHALEAIRAGAGAEATRTDWEGTRHGMEAQALGAELREENERQAYDPKPEVHTRRHDSLPDGSCEPSSMDRAKAGARRLGSAEMRIARRAAPLAACVRTFHRASQRRHDLTHARGARRRRPGCWPRLLVRVGGGGRVVASARFVDQPPWDAASCFRRLLRAAWCAEAGRSSW